MAGIVVKPRARILHGHDWVFSSEVLKVFGKPADGDVISLKDGKDRLIGSAIYNSKSQIVARRFSRRKQEMDLDFFKRRIAQAAEYRIRRGVDPRLCRVVWSESDGLPGLIHRQVWRSFRDAGAHARRSTFEEIWSPMRLLIFLGTPRSSSEMTRLFGRRKGWNCTQFILRGDAPPQIEIEIEGVKFEIDLLHGQKTGFYLDQKHSYAIVAELASGRRVLDCFTNRGNICAYLRPRGCDGRDRC